MRNNGKAIVMNSEKKLVPSLRFPAFQQDGEWKEQEFGSLFNPLPNNTLSRADLKEGKGEVYNVHYGDVLIKLNSYTDIQQGKLPAIKTVNDIDKYLKSRLQDGDIVIADTAEDETVGKCTEIVNVHETIVVSGLHTIPCRPQIKFAQAYLGYYMNSNAFHSKLLPIMQGVKVTSISKTSLQNIDLVFPESLEEQQKIAECLSSIDSYISSINEKVEQLNAHKKSLMQKLFPQNGKTVPEYRFPEFVDNGEWEIVKLREIAIRVKNKNKFNEQLPVLTNSATEGIVNQQDYFDREIVTRDNLSNYFIVKIDDFVYNPRISSLAPVGPISRNKIERGIISPLYTIFRFCKGCIDYFDYYFRTNCWHQYLRSIANFGARFDRMNITNEEFMNMPIPFPSVAEQQKIAECLSSIDKTIGSFLEKESQIEIYKKGLMQQLFPVKK